MYYILIAIILFLCIITYFKVAEKFNIVDCPNERSSHNKEIIRGGGIIFPVSFVLFLISFLLENSNINKLYFFFGCGMIIISIISFMDDIVKLSPKIRLIFHFISVTLLLLSINAFTLPIWIIVIYYIFVIGILNSYNFMDGINGITGIYSLITLCTLYIINDNTNLFDNDFIIYPILACLVFLFFNFRKHAKCFAGDIGSFSISFWIITIIAGVIIYTGNYKYLLLLSVYGVDSVLTIIERIKLRENIFDAHRKHLYQLLVNEKQYSHLLISFLYAFIQSVINFILIKTDLSFGYYFLIIVVPLIIIYSLIKIYIKNSIEEIND